MSALCAVLGSGGWVAIIMPIAILAAAMWAITRLFPAAPPPDPRSVLDARLAAGDIDVVAYRRACDELAGAPHIATTATP